ncbi:hypothetical protein MNB_SV-6-1368 [hydrothermal vent metagenome]|uniref:Uncharacterized protein n=1 Tax=hydrothermal vent metagenome TaxID=652676 RepID=A0A1W1BXU2_9ZZZZ
MALKLLDDSDPVMNAVCIHKYSHFVQIVLQNLGQLSLLPYA